MGSREKQDVVRAQIAKSGGVGDLKNLLGFPNPKKSVVQVRPMQNSRRFNKAGDKEIIILQDDSP